MGYLVDSNVFIDYVSERFSESQLQLLDAIFDDALNVSIITKMKYWDSTFPQVRNAECLSF